MSQESAVTCSHLHSNVKTWPEQTLGARQKKRHDKTRFFKFIGTRIKKTRGAPSEESAASVRMKFSRKPEALLENYGAIGAGGQRRSEFNRSVAFGSRNYNRPVRCVVGYG